MNTTVKDFIINNMTDDNFERLVHELIVYDIFHFRGYDMDGIASDLAELDLQQSRSFKGQNTFTILNTIKNSKKDDLNLPSSFIKKLVYPFLIKVLKMELDQETDKDDLCWMETKYDIDVNGLNCKNYKFFVIKELKNKTNNLAKFIYEILHSQPGESQADTSEIFKEWLKLQPNPDLIRRSLVEITNQAKHSSDYCVRIMVDNRTRYLSDDLHKYFYVRFEETIPIKNVEFIDCELLYEDLYSTFEYLLEPFTHYLNEPIIVPSAVEEIIYDILLQFISVLTAQGFTEEEQLVDFQYRNQDFGATYK